MLTYLFGSRAAAQVLLFLSINQEGYASEIARTLEVPLSVAQKYLLRFEQEGLLVSIPRGTIRIFRWNPRYPLIKEVRALLERAVEFLPEDERARYAIRLRPRRTGKPL
jgi:DNA-binding IclR family transcriptional regulator